MKHAWGAIAVVVSAGLWIGFADEPSRQVEWPYYGGDQGGMKYSTLTDINPSNVQRLQVAWQWKHWEAPMPEYGTFPGFFESTPLMIDGVLYVTTPYNSIAALDQLHHLFRRLIEGNANRFSSRHFDGALVLRERSLRILPVGRMRHGNGDARGHGLIVTRWGGALFRGCYDRISPAADCDG